jgi:hypothetical protein
MARPNLKLIEQSNTEPANDEFWKEPVNNDGFFKLVFVIGILIWVMMRR